ncbi:polysaccharide biosynthesis/export family protein, partial [Planctomycetota bacterium]
MAHNGRNPAHWRGDAGAVSPERLLVSAPPCPEEGAQGQSSARRLRARAAGGSASVPGTGGRLPRRTHGHSCSSRSQEVSSLELEVGTGGYLAMPFAGFVKAAGATAEEIRGRIVEALGEKYLVDPQVMVSVKQYRSKQIVVTGEVARPGTFYLRKNHVGVVEALSMAGGLSPEAGTKAFVIGGPSSARAAGG